jgi:Domain of unknown function (DUF4169)
MNELVIAVPPLRTWALLNNSHFPKLSPLSDFSSHGEASMGEIVNLKRFRKRIEREDAGREAEANRARFGRTKSERERDKKRDDRAAEIFDQHRLDEGDAS